MSGAYDEHSENLGETEGAQQASGIGFGSEDDGVSTNKATKAIKKVGKSVKNKIINPHFILISGCLVSGALIVEGLLCFSSCAGMYVCMYIYISYKNACALHHT